MLWWCCILLLVQDTLHASPNYYKRGAWFDAVRAKHAVPATGQSRRRPEERSAQERRAIADGAPRYSGVATDVARILGLYFCTIPEGAPSNAGEVFPFLYVEWQGFFNPLADFTDVPQGQHANLKRCMKLLAQWDIEAVRKDPLEFPYCLEPSQIDAIAYLQNGYFRQRGGAPDFHWVDTMHSKL